MRVCYRFTAWITTACVALALMHPVIADEPAGGGITEEQAEPKIETGAENSERQAPPQHWLGVMGEPVSDALKAQLNVEGGLLVTQVVDGSPASKAGLKAHDVMVQFGEAKIATLEDLIKALRQADGAETEMVVMRGGEKTTLQITPEKRPEAHWPAVQEELDDVVNGFPFNELIVPGGPDNIRLWALRPGVVLGGAAEFPKNTSIQVERGAEGPAKIVVKQGDKTWEVTDESLDKLPAEIRPLVQRMLLGGHAARVQALRRDGPRENMLELRRVAPPEIQSRITKHMEVNSEVLKRMDELMSKLDQLEKDVQELKENQSP